MTSAPTDVRKTINAKMMDYLEALKSLDVGRIAPFYLDHPDFRVFSDGQAMDRDGLLKLVASLGEALENFDAVWEEIEVTVLGDESALAAARFTRALTDKSGDVVRDWGTVTWVWVRDEEDWRLIHGHAVHYPESASA